MIVVVVQDRIYEGDIIMKLKVTTERTFARSELRQRLRKSGYTGYATIDEMETHIQCLGFGLPTEHENGYGFRLGKYTRISLNYADNLSELIILINTK